MTDPTTMSLQPAEPPLPTGAEMAATFERLKNWGRWGADDELGALRLITPESRVAAAGLIRSGVTVSMAHDVTTEPTPQTPDPAQHQMLACGDDLGSDGIPGYEATRDAFGTDVHGMGITHLDALCHMFVEGRMFNGASADLVTADGAERNSVMTAADGIVGRGVLLDVPAARGVDFLEPEQRITVADLLAAQDRQGLEVGSGDLLVIATGRDARTISLGGQLNPFTDGLAGLHPECLTWLRERDVALLASDGISDPMPITPIDLWPFPVHQIGIVGIGLMLIDNMRLDTLIAECERHQRWEFFMQLSPLRLPGATGCPVNPIATF